MIKCAKDKSTMVTQCHTPVIMIGSTPKRQQTNTLQEMMNKRVKKTKDKLLEDSCIVDKEILLGKKATVDHNCEADCVQALLSFIPIAWQPILASQFTLSYFKKV